jgi:aspartate/methionine/tyrosine aminotransferase
MDPPDAAVEDVIAALRQPGHARYQPAGGSAEVRTVLAEVFSDLGITAKAENTLLINGAKETIDVALRSLIGKYGTVFWFAPGYTYERAAVLNRLKTQRVKMTADFLPDFDNLEAEVDSCEGVLIVNNPGNPTGRLWDESVLRRLVEIAESQDLWLIADETYGDLIHEGRFVSIASLPGASERTITIRSASKELRMPGYRLGYACAPAEVAGAMKTMLGDCVGCPNVLASAIARRQLPLHEQYASDQMIQLSLNRRMVINFCLKLGLRYSPIDGAFYAFIDFKPLIDKLELADSIELADYLLENKSIGIIPGQAFDSVGSTAYATWARLSLAGGTNDLHDGLKAIDHLM